MKKRKLLESNTSMSIAGFSSSTSDDYKSLGANQDTKYRHPLSTQAHQVQGQLAEGCPF